MEHQLFGNGQPGLIAILRREHVEQVTRQNSQHAENKKQLDKIQMWFYLLLAATVGQRSPEGIKWLIDHLAK